jgi:hypothetical protein
MEAQCGSPHSSFTWVKFNPQFHSYLIHLMLCLLTVCYHPDGSWPSAGMVQKAKKIMFIFLLELLSEEPARFFDSPPDPWKVASAEKQCLAQKKTWAAQKEKG